MAIDVTVLRVFTDPDGNFGNPLGVVDASHGRAQPTGSGSPPNWVTAKRYSSICRKSGANTAHARIFTPATELPFAGHPTVGASWWLRDRGTPVHTLQVPAGIVQVTYDDDLTAVSARSEWAPDFAIYDLASTDELFAADPDDYPDDVEHYLWTWTRPRARRRSGRGCSPPTSACPRTRRPAPPRCASPTTSAAT